METTSCIFNDSTQMVSRNISGTNQSWQDNKTVQPFTIGDRAIYASLVVSSVLLVLGLFGNTVTILLMRNKPFRNNSHGIYLTALAFADNASLLVHPVKRRFFQELFGKDIRGLSVVGCQLYTYAYRATKICSSVFIVLICIERFAAVWFPLKARLFLVRRAGLIQVCCIYMGVYSLSILFGLHAGVRRGRCLHDIINEHDIWSQISATTAWALNSVIPTAFLLCLTPLTIGKLYHQRIVRRRMGGHDIVNTTHYITAMLMSTVMAYNIFVTSFSIVFQVFKLQGINLPSSTEHWAVAFVEIIQISEQINCAINIFIYGFYNYEFRRQFFQLFTCVQSRPQLHGSSSNVESIHSGRNITAQSEILTSRQLTDTQETAQINMHTRHA